MFTNNQRKSQVLAKETEKELGSLWWKNSECLVLWKPKKNVLERKNSRLCRLLLRIWVQWEGGVHPCIWQAEVICTLVKGRLSGWGWGGNGSLLKSVEESLGVSSKWLTSYMCAYNDVCHTVVSTPVSPPTQAARYAVFICTFPIFSTVSLIHNRHSLNCWDALKENPGSNFQTSQVLYICLGTSRKLLLFHLLSGKIKKQGEQCQSPRVIVKME